MKIDCLCVTTSTREPFKHWVIWNYLKQTHGEKELIVVSDDDDWPDFVTVVRMGINESVPVKRNAALAAANGEAITWFDDDDWQSPQKLSVINKFVDMRTNVGCDKSFFLDISKRKVTNVHTPQLPLFNSIGVYRAALPSFAENMIKYSDTDWLNKLRYRGNYIVDKLLFFWITHNNNMSNPIHKINPIDKLIYSLDSETWQQLRKLEANLNNG